MKKILFGIVILVSSMRMSAQVITELQAFDIARSFVEKTTGQRVLELNVISTEYIGDLPVYYVFNHNLGFVIVSAELQYEPVLAYSTESVFPDNTDMLPPEMITWMSALADDIHRVRLENDFADEQATLNRNRILSNEPLSRTRAVSEMLSTTWSQGCGYNAQCPVDGAGPCGRVYTGCVATAHAQVMKYHSHPASGNGSACYTHSVYGELCADFSTANYDWTAMSNTSGNAEVAELMYHCGVSVSMNYSPTGSGSYLSKVRNALETYFDYTKNMDFVTITGFDLADWESLMRKECDQGRVVPYKGTGSGGHAFVLDGYDDFGAFHFNWGWGGTANGYYMMGTLNPAGHNYSNSNAAIIGVVPSSGFTGLDFSAVTNLTCGSNLAVDMSSGTSNVNVYSNAYLNCVGKERVFEFATAYPGRITINITNQSDDISVILLDAQHEDSVLSYGTNSLLYDNSVPGTYYLVLDVAKAQNATCDLELVCPTIDADLVVTDCVSIPDAIQSGQTNVLFRSRIKNIGNTDAGTSELHYYLSDNDTLDGGDLFLASTSVPPVAVGEHISIQSYHNMPTLLGEGFYRLICVPDATNLVAETVDDDYYCGYVAIPAPGTMDCSSSYALVDHVWYWGNTETQGDSIIDNYSCGWDCTGNEMIFSFTPANSGLARINLSEKLLGELSAQVFPMCNENVFCLASVSIWDVPDTVASIDVNVVSGVEYFIVIDGMNDASGNFGVKVDMPDLCPSDTLYYWGSSDLCDGDGPLFLQTDWGYSNYQWYKDGLPISGEISAMYNADANGEYWVEITENSCTVESDHVTLTYSPAPDTAHIIALTDTLVCFDETVELMVDAGDAFDIKWYKDGVEIPDADSIVYFANTSGEYYADVINVSCHLSSNTISVIVGAEPVDFGEQIQPSSLGLKYYFPFDMDNLDASGNNVNISTWSLYPTDGYDNSFWTARQLLDSSTMAYVTTLYPDPAEFTHAFWFKTNEVDGGVLLQLNDSPYGTGTIDRVLYMSDDGRLHFFVSNSGMPVEVSSLNSYNDGVWHHVVVSVDNFMEMTIDDGFEVINDVSALSLDPLTGYWVYGGTTLPPALTDPPTDPYFQGAFDEIRYYNRKLSWMESTHFINDYSLEANLRFDTVCDGGDVYLDFVHSQPGIQYVVRDVASGDTLFGSPVGTGAVVTAGPDWFTATTEFEILAIDTNSNCTKLLSNTFVFEVLSTLSPEIEILLSPGDSVCDGMEISFSPDVISAGGISPEFEWFTNGVSQGLMFDYITSSLSDQDSVSLIMTSDYSCLSVSSDTANAIVTIHSLPDASFIYPPSVCEYDTFAVTYSGTTLDVASINWDINGALQTNSGGGQQWFNAHSGLLTVGCTVETIYACSAYFTGPVISYDAPSSVLSDTVWMCPLDTIELDPGSDADVYSWSNGDVSQSILVPAVDSTYVLTLTNNTGGCTEEDSVKVLVYNQDYVFNFPEGSDTTVCAEDGLQYALDALYTDVFWTVEGVSCAGNSLDMPIPDTDTILLCLSYKYPPAYCCGYDTILVYAESCSGIDIERNLIFDVYPNPTSNLVNISLPQTNQVLLKIFDITGKEIMLIKPESNLVAVDVSNFSEGIYMIEYKCNNQHNVKRLEIIR